MKACTGLSREKPPYHYILHQKKYSVIQNQILIASFGENHL